MITYMNSTQGPAMTKAVNALYASVQQCRQRLNNFARDMSSKHMSGIPIEDDEEDNVRRRKIKDTRGLHPDLVEQLETTYKVRSL